MLDIKFIRENKERVIETALNKHVEIDIEKLLSLDEKKRKIQKEIEDLRQQRNIIADKLKNPAERNNQIISEGQKIKESIARLEEKINPVENEFNKLMFAVPNVVSEDTPIGPDDSGNLEIKKWGEPTKFNFLPKDHIDLCHQLDWLDLERGAEVAGFRGYFLKNEGAKLHLALIMFALNKIISKGFTPMIVPVLAKEFVLYGSGHFPWGQQESYHLKDDDLYLLGTAEPALAAYYANKTFTEEELPIKLVGFSPCYRREIGSYGKDTRGIYRIHEFWKVEQFIFDVADENKALENQELLQQNGEEILEDLKLPYRVLKMCTGDMGEPQYRKYDTEAWIPSKNSYGELQSNSIMTDFQARRLNIRYKTKSGEMKFIYMFNDTAIASPRALIPIIENNQNEDGTINIPAVLKPYIH